MDFRVTYPPELPITASIDELRAHISTSQVVIVAGETGSGKSTQLPKLCLDLGRGEQGRIGHTQPRRIAARSVADRVAEELGTEVGGIVGCTIRFSDHVGDDTRIKVMTDGILLAETRRDRLLRAYDTLVIDEAHERTLNIDFLLGYVKQLLPKRPDLKVIITSATIDTETFAAHFCDETGPAPIVQVSGRGYPVDVRYRPFGVEPDDDRDQTQAIADAVSELHCEGPGDVLVFLSGEREIHDTADALRRLDLRDTEILPLYARLSNAEQRRIFQPHRGRRIVLSTNVAETSLTVPGVVYVIDAGTARISRYNRRLKVQRLPIEPVSKASANQRAGRCGRIAPGICIRLYSEKDFADRPDFTDPEILRTNLASVILQAASLDLGDIAEFPFVDPPDRRAIKDGVALLEELGAFDPEAKDVQRKLTPLGRRLARLPIDPRLGRMVLEAERNGCIRDVAVIASALSIQDPRERPAAAAQEADAMHGRFRKEGSDFLGILALWDHVRERQGALTKNEFRRMCRAEFLNYLRVREWQDVNRQLRDSLGELGINATKRAADADAIHLSLLAGLLSQIGMRASTDRDFTGARNARFIIAPGSVTSRKPPKWVMVAELVETNRLWGRVAARIQPDWAERVGAHLCKYTYGDPHWERSRGAVVAVERATLYGLPVVVGRSVDFARIDPEHARALFIRHALVERDWTTKHQFMRDNEQAMTEVRALEDRVRRRDLLIGEDGLCEFYAARIPADVTSARSFDSWWKKAIRSDPALLLLTSHDLFDDSARTLSEGDYPDVWRHDELRLRLTYVFDPRNPVDGTLVQIPLALLDRVRADDFAWHVPGRRSELVEELIRQLPREVRRHLAPISNVARRFTADYGPPDGPLLTVLSGHLNRFVAESSGGGIVTDIAPGHFTFAALPDHLRFTFTVVDDQQQPIAADKELARLRSDLGRQVRGAVASALGAAFEEQGGLTTWSIGEIPRHVDVARGANTVRGFPALVDEGSTVALRVLTTADHQERAMAAGTRRLLQLTVPVPRKQLERLLSNDARLALARASVGSIEDFIDDCATASFDELLVANGGPVWDADAFDQLRSAVHDGLWLIASQLVASSGAVLAAAGDISSRADRVASASPVCLPAVEDIRAQIRWLVHRGFVSSTGAGRLVDIVRYLAALGLRIEKLPGDAARDRQRMAVVRTLQHDVDDLLLDAPTPRRAQVLALRWSVEELRVGLWAQSMKTVGPASEQKLRRELDRLRA